MRTLAGVLFCILAGAGCVPIDAPMPPSQAASGPGGADYVHAKVVAERLGEGGETCWIFRPEDPRPATAPLVVFMHGWMGIDPAVYGAWIAHTVRKGHIVIFPEYQDNAYTDPADMTPNTVACLEAAQAHLMDEGPVRPRTDAVGWVGHSLGAVIAVRLATDPDAHPLPPPAFLMLVEPGGTQRIDFPASPDLPEAVRVLVVTGADDNWVGDGPAEEIIAYLENNTSITPAFVTMPSDNHGWPPLRASHFAPLAVLPDFPPPLSRANDGIERAVYDAEKAGSEPAATRFPPDALDYYGFWKLLDGLLDASFRDKNADYAIGDTPEQRFMGRFSDGTPVNPLIVRQAGD